jgi:hypothetical protein
METITTNYSSFISFNLYYNKGGDKPMVIPDYDICRDFRR